MTSKTGKNRGQFKKGDPRINRKGRPKTFDGLRKLALQIAHEKVKRDGQPLIINGRAVSVAEMILRKWAASPNSKLQTQFIEVAFGKVPAAIELKHSGEVRFDVDEWKAKRKERLREASQASEATD